MTISIFFSGLNPCQDMTESDPTSLKGEAKRLGFEVVGSLADSPQKVICVDWNASDRIFKRWLNKNKETATLVIQEPDVVIPEHSDVKLKRLFKTVIEVGRPYSNPIVPWPQTWNPKPEPQENKFTDRAVLIQSAKYSFVKGQLYGLRIRLASSEQRIDVFGHGWGESPWRTITRLSVELARALKGRAKLDLTTLETAFKKPTNYLGFVKSKMAGMSNYKVAVIIENSQDYMSEKLFDAFFARCIPVYVGADLEPFGIPQSLYVKADPTQQSVSEAISLALSENYNEWVSRVDEFLDNPATRNKWDGKEATRKVLELVLGMQVDGG